MRHLDLFSGIGGFAFAADKVWDNVEHIFCDNDNFVRRVLKKHWPESYVYNDIRHITDANIFGSLEGRSEVKPAERNQTQLRFTDGIDLLTGGFPCQPFSAAGLRRGTDDERHLWPEMLRVIRITQPTWVIAENVRGLLTLEGGVVFEQVCLDLEAAGYEVQPFIIPAVAVNAPHRRDRVWFVAHTIDGGQRGTKRGSLTESDRLPREHRAQDSAARQSERTAGNGQAIQSDSNTERKRRPRSSSENAGRSGFNHRDGFDKRRDWDEDWLKVATRLCSVDDGLPVSVGGFKLSRAASRKHQLKAYGNAIVPQVAVQIMKGMSL